MSFETEFAEFMNDSVTWYPQDSTSTYGRRTYSSTGTTITGRLADITIGKSSDYERSVNARSKFYCAGHYAVTVQDKVEVTDRPELVLIRVAQYPDEDGDHHTVLYFGDVLSGVAS